MLSFTENTKNITDKLVDTGNAIENFIAFTVPVGAALDAWFYHVTTVDIPDIFRLGVLSFPAAAAFVGSLFTLFSFIILWTEIQRSIKLYNESYYEKRSQYNNDSISLSVKKKLTTQQKVRIFFELYLYQILGRTILFSIAVFLTGMAILFASLSAIAATGVLFGVLFLLSLFFIYVLHKTANEDDTSYTREILIGILAIMAIASIAGMVLLWAWSAATTAIFVAFFTSTALLWIATITPILFGVYILLNIYALWFSEESKNTINYKIFKTSVNLMLLALIISSLAFFGGVPIFTLLAAVAIIAVLTFTAFYLYKVISHNKAKNYMPNEQYKNSQIFIFAILFMGFLAITSAIVLLAIFDLSLLLTPAVFIALASAIVLIGFCYAALNYCLNSNKSKNNFAVSLLTTLLLGVALGCLGAVLFLAAPAILPMITIGLVAATFGLVLGYATAYVLPRMWHVYDRQLSSGEKTNQSLYISQEKPGQALAVFRIMAALFIAMTIIAALAAVSYFLLPAAFVFIAPVVAGMALVGVATRYFNFEKLLHNLFSSKNNSAQSIHNHQPNTVGVESGRLLFSEQNSQEVDPKLESWFVFN